MARFAALLIMVTLFAPAPAQAADLGGGLVPGISTATRARRGIAFP